MAVALTNPTLSTTYSSTEQDANNADIVSKFNAGIVNADVNASAAIALSKLAASYQEVWLQLEFSAVKSGAWPAAAADPDKPTFAETLDYVPLPGTDADTAWVATDVSWTCNDTGTASGSFGVFVGAYAAGVMEGNGSPVIATAPITFVAADQGNEGRALEGGTVTVTQGAAVRGLYLVSTAQGTVVMDDTAAPGSWLRVTVALRRQITTAT